MLQDRSKLSKSVKIPVQDHYYVIEKVVRAVLGAQMGPRDHLYCQKVVPDRSENVTKLCTLMLRTH